MVDKYEIIKIINQAIFLIVLVLIIAFFVKIDMNAFLIPKAQNISSNMPFLTILIAISCLSGLNVVLIMFIKEPQKKEVIQVK